MNKLLAFVPSWGKLAFGAAVLLLALAGLWKVKHTGIVEGRAEVQSKWDAEEKERAVAILRAMDRKANANQGVDREYQTTKNRIAVDKRAAADRLRDFQAAASADTEPDASSGVDDPYRAIASQCAAALGILDGYAQDVAGKAKALQGYTREVCLKD